MTDDSPAAVEAVTLSLDAVDVQDPSPCAEAPGHEEPRASRRNELNTVVRHSVSGVSSEESNTFEESTKLASTKRA